MAARRWGSSLSGADGGDILVDGHVLLEACESALTLHCGDILGLEVDYTLLIADAVGIIEILCGSVESVGFLCGHRVHYYYLYIFIN